MDVDASVNVNVVADATADAEITMEVTGDCGTTTITDAAALSGLSFCFPSVATETVSALAAVTDVEMTTTAAGSSCFSCSVDAETTADAANGE